MRTVSSMRDARPALRELVSQLSSGLRTTVPCSPTTYSLTLNWQVPTGLRAKSALNFWTADGETIENPATSFMKAALGWLNTTLAVYLSTTCVSLYGPRAPAADLDLVAGSTMWSKVTLTALASNCVPSWNLTSCLSLNV